MQVKPCDKCKNAAISLYKCSMCGRNVCAKCYHMDTYSCRDHARPIQIAESPRQDIKIA